MAARGAGARDTRVVFERAQASLDDHGGEVSAWGDLGKEHAAIIYGRGSERRQAAMERGAQSVTVQARANNLTRGVTVRDRVRFSGRTWDIEGIVPRRDVVEFDVSDAGEAE